jgi:hypothetical protein
MPAERPVEPRFDEPYSAGLFSIVFAWCLWDNPDILNEDSLTFCKNAVISRRRDALCMRSK